MRSGHRGVPFERAVRGELEGSRGGRVYVHARDDLSDRATPLSGTQLSRELNNVTEAATSPSAKHTPQHAAAEASTLLETN
jgi:hypothetical protein